MTLDCVCFESCDTASDDERELCYLTLSCVSNIGWGGYKAGDGERGGCKVLQVSQSKQMQHKQGTFSKDYKLHSVVISLLKYEI